jgi:ferredoxin-type protein NapG
MPDFKHGISRRNFCIGIGGTAALFGLGTVKLVGSKPILRPPGGQNYDLLIAGCIRCQKCVEVCPRKVIKPAHIENGLLGIRTPTLNFDKDYCDWCAEHNGGVPLCIEVCATGALSVRSAGSVALTAAATTPQNTVLGQAEVDTTSCLAYRDLSCRFCFDACPYEAMELDSNKRPHVIASKCNGCGACESVCVSLKVGSITSFSPYADTAGKDLEDRAVKVRALDEDGRIVDGFGDDRTSGFGIANTRERETSEYEGSQM